jgi:hypothetical protein
MGLDIPDQNVATGLFLSASRGEHGIRFANSRGVPKKDFQHTTFGLGFVCLNLGE